VTPFLKRLFGERQQALAELLTEHRSKEAPLLEDLHAATEEHKHLLGKREVIEARLAELSKPLTEEEKTRRLGGEEKAGRSEEVVRGRRVDEWQRGISAAQVQLDALSDQAHRASIAAGRAKDRLDALRKVTHAQGLAIISYYEQRKGSYLTGLAHQHRRGPELVRALALIDPGLPDWLSWTNDALEGA
jgi:chromosome segregation ATPase